MYTLVINPGSTSTKVALFEDDKELHKKTLRHSKEELSAFATIPDQFDFRYNLVIGFLGEIGFAPSKLDCVISRGGSPPDVRSGATEIGEALITALRERPKEPHPACVGPMIAYRISQDEKIPSYIYDPITADELNPLARVFGVKGIEHDSMCHVLNSRAMSIAVSTELRRDFNDMTFVVAHFGGGNSMALWHKGQLTDVVPGDAGTFSSERCGPIRGEKLLQLAQQYDFKTMSGWFHGKGGMVSLLGTNDLQEVERMVSEGSAEAKLCQDAMGYQLAKCIASLFPAVSGRVDGIILTGGGAYWRPLTDDVQARLAYLNTPIYVRPGENEMQSLAEGALRVCTGKEKAHIFA
jgi:butyrate kinase